MKVSFSTRVLSDDASFRYISAIFWMFIDGRHQWVVEDPGEIRRSTWLENVDKRTRYAVTDLLRQVARRTDSANIVVDISEPKYDSARGVWVAPPEIAAWHLSRPLLIIVENAHCDGAFAKLILTVVADRQVRRRLGSAAFDRLKREWKRSPLGDGRWFEVRHGGGGTTAVQLKIVAAQATNLPPRFAVFLDSDRDAQGGDIGETAKAVDKAVTEINKDLPTGQQLSTFILDKHEVENYLPLEVLRHRYATKKPDAFSRWNALSENEKDYADLKELFGKKLWKTLVENEYQGHLHKNAMRKRAGDMGRELNRLADHLLANL